MKIGAKGKGFGDVLKNLREMVDRAKDPKDFLAFIGYEMVYSSEGVKHEFDTKGEGSWPDGPKLRAGELLRDTRKLERSISYRVTGRNVAIGTNDFVGFVHQHGMTIKAKTPAGLRFIARDPNFQGPVRLGASRRRAPKKNVRSGKWGPPPEGHRWYRLAQVTIPARPFLAFRPFQIEKFRNRFREWAATGKGIPKLGAQGGQPNVRRGKPSR